MTEIGELQECQWSGFLGVHRNQNIKIRAEPELAGTEKNIRPELPARTGTPNIDKF